MGFQDAGGNEDVVTRDWAPLFDRAHTEWRGQTAMTDVTLEEITSGQLAPGEEESPPSDFAD